jgi:hypothetical protein
VQQGSQPGPIRSRELDPFAVQMSFEDQDLVSEREDFGVLFAVTHR